MTSIYMVRHAQPDFGWKDDRTRPLDPEGEEDRHRVSEALKEIPLQYAVSSPYKRSIDTIAPCARQHQLEVNTDERLRERQTGNGGNTHGLFEKRWGDFSFREEGGESLAEVQSRNVEAMEELLMEHEGEQILLGTHGTALSTILNYYVKSYGCREYLRMIDFMPYVIRLDFAGQKLIGREEILIVEKEYKE